MGVYAGSAGFVVRESVVLFAYCLRLIYRNDLVGFVVAKISMRILKMAKRKVCR